MSLRKVAFVEKRLDRKKSLFLVICWLACNSTPQSAKLANQLRGSIVSVRNIFRLSTKCLFGKLPLFVVVDHFRRNILLRQREFWEFKKKQFSEDAVSGDWSRRDNFGPSDQHGILDQLASRTENRFLLGTGVEVVSRFRNSFRLLQVNKIKYTGITNTNGLFRIYLLIFKWFLTILNLRGFLAIFSGHFI